MTSFSSRVLARATSIIAGLGMSIACVTGGAANGHALRVQTSSGQRTSVPSLRHPTRLARDSTAQPATCATSDPGASFVGVDDANVAGGAEAGVVGGYNNEACDDYDGIGGGYSNAIGNAGNAEFSSIGGGMGNGITGQESFIGAGNQNGVTGATAFDGAGTENTVSGNGSFVGAGVENTVSAYEAFIGAGAFNNLTSSANFSTLAGGYGNTMVGQKAALGGGEQNDVSGSFATIPGGYRDEALGNESFAAGSQAEARYTGSFVWSDYVSGEKPQGDSAAGEFVARASGGVYFFSNAGSSTGVHLAAGSGTWSSLSDRNAKTAIVPLDDASILAKVATLRISSWQYKTERGVRHVGPMAQDFYAAFGVGEDDRHITSIDEDGVALAAIKALREQNRIMEREISELHRENRAIVRAMEAKQIARNR